MFSWKANILYVPWVKYNIQTDQKMLRFCVGVDSPNAKHSPSVYLGFVGVCGAERCALSDANSARRSSAWLLRARSAAVAVSGSAGWCC